MLPELSLSVFGLSSSHVFIAFYRDLTTDIRLSSISLSARLHYILTSLIIVAKGSKLSAIVASIVKMLENLAHLFVFYIAESVIVL